METAVRVRIAGRVQRVGFRYWVIAEATRRDLRGWVRNRLDGSVEALLIGPPAAVEDMIAACHHGPPAAVVTSVTAEQTVPVPAATGFTSLPAA